ncbi:Down syndrome cell adhesion molecule-like protein, partial [Leptotrombidium deliense]
MLLIFALCFLSVFRSGHASVAPKLSPFPTFNSLKEGSIVRVFCGVQQGSAPLYFNWFFNSKLITNHFSDIEIETNEGESVLRIKKLLSNHTGNYTCIVRNGVGEDTPAKWVIEPHDLRLNAGESGKLECSASGIPLPTIQWKKDDNNILSDSGVVNILKSTEKDSGTYECVANNN